MKLLIAFIIVFAGFTAFAEEDRETCFRERSIRNWRAIDSRTLEVWGRRNARYRLDVWSCFELQWSNKIAFRGFGGSNRICRNDDVLVLDDFSNKVIDRCRIKRITRIK